MILYIPAPSAQPLSDALWGLVVDTEYEIRMHDEAELGNIADILAPFVGNGLTQADIDGLAAYVIASRGKTITVYGAFP